MFLAEALDDAVKAIDLDSQAAKAYFRKGSARTRLSSRSLSVILLFVCLNMGPRVTRDIETQLCLGERSLP